MKKGHRIAALLAASLAITSAGSGATFPNNIGTDFSKDSSCVRSSAYHSNGSHYRKDCEGWARHQNLIRSKRRAKNKARRKARRY